MKVSLFRFGVASLVLVVATVVLAQPPGDRRQGREGTPREGGRPNMMMGMREGMSMGGGLGRLLTVEQVQSALSLSEAQKEAIQKWQEEQRTAWQRPEGRQRPEGNRPPREGQGRPEARQGGQERRELTPEQREESRKQMEEAMAQRNAETMKKLAEILDSKQIERLKQIQLQLEGVAALRRPEVQKQLKLTDAQKQQLNDIATELMTQRREAMRSSQGNWEQSRAKMEEVRAAMQKKSMGVLTADQKTELGKMMGEPANIDPTTLWRGGNRRPQGEGEGGRGSRGNRSDRSGRVPRDNN